MLKNSEARYTKMVPFQKLHFSAMLGDCESGPGLCELIVTNETKTTY